ncbi:MAG: 50S ribosomal protein L24 [Candidatus Pacebacteria bacterium]|nr:50S ribosomal protein L24 [Candidatus Paceibacterota bacterium]
MNIKKGDNVIVLKGKDSGKKGKVLRVFPKLDTVLVDGLNMKKRHKKKTQSGGKGQMVDMSHPIRRSNVALVDPKSGKATRLGKKEVNGKKVRIARKSGQEV